ncbi:Organic hydroperoxide resistance transcriptional regulator [compost metagenome]
MEQMLRLDNQICFPLYAASRLMIQLYGPLLARHKITYLQYLVLMILWEKKTQTVSEIGSALLLDSGTLTPLIKKLETRGFVLRVRSARDERRVDVKLTAAGRKLQTAFKSVPRELFSGLHCSAPELQSFKKQLNKLIGSMQKTLKGGFDE